MTEATTNPLSVSSDVPGSTVVSEGRKTDQVFLHVAKNEDFKFDAKVADVFDDMLARSVPHYNDVQNLIMVLAKSYAQPATNVYDLGCSLGTTCLLIAQNVESSISIVGIDNSVDMLKKAQERVSQTTHKDRIRFVHTDIDEHLKIENASLAVLSLTLQFLRPAKREKILGNICDQLQPGGSVILFEKIVTENSPLNRLFIDQYYEFKKGNGYSEAEIANKRLALENVLIPYTIEENLQLMKDAGLKQPNSIFQWLNFAAFVGTKDQVCKRVSGTDKVEPTVPPVKPANNLDGLTRG